MHHTLETDLLIIGGGVTGLWALNTLHQQGFNVRLLESNALGAFQTIHSQGIIHGGLKYALAGKLSQSSKAIQHMPQLWQACLDGTGEIDLSQTQILSRQQYLWSTDRLKSKLITFFASKLLAARINKCTPNTYPPILQHPKFNGQVYALQETNLQIPSLLKNLSDPLQHCMIHTQSDLTLNFTAQNQIKSISFKTQDHTPVTLKAQAYIFAAGEQNAKLTEHLISPPPMQTRPLHMVYIKFLKDHPTFFAHCMEGYENPRITITTHTTSDHKTIWYCGGELAETGVQRSASEQITFAKQSFQSLLPWLDLSQTEWGSFLIHRAEAKQTNAKRPTHATLEAIGNTYVAWPTKLAFAPIVSHALQKALQHAGISPNQALSLNHTEFPSPPIAKPYWEKN